jgi:hypothetical protein
MIDTPTSNAAYAAVILLACLQAERTGYLWHQICGYRPGYQSAGNGRGKPWEAGQGQAQEGRRNVTTVTSASQATLVSYVCSTYSHA